MYLNKSDEKKEAIDLFKKADYQYSEDDKLIVDYLDNGWVSVEDNRDMLARMKEREGHETINAAVQKLWRKYYHGFVPTEVEVCDGMIAFLKKNWRQMRLGDVASMNEFLKKLGRGNFDNLVDQSIDLALPWIDKTDTFIWRDALPKEAQEKVRQKISAIDRTRPIPDVIFEMSSPGGWNPSDIRGLLKYNEEDFYQWLISEKSESLSHSLREFISRTAGDTQHGGKGVTEKIKNALEKLRTRSKMDDNRVSSMLRDE
jgi:hypothetical protein